MFAIFTHNGEFSKSLEGDLSWDRVRRCRLFNVIQVHNRNCSFKKNSVVVVVFANKVRNWNIVDSYKYQVSLLTCVIACKLGNSVFFLFFPLKYGVGESEKKKKQQESEDKMRARLDKRIERARARHELAH